MINRLIFAEYKEGVEYFYDFAFKNTALLYQGWAYFPCNDVAIKKYLIGIQFISIYIRVDLCPTTSIGSYMERRRRKLQGLEASKTGT